MVGLQQLICLQKCYSYAKSDKKHTESTAVTALLLFSTQTPPLKYLNMICFEKLHLLFKFMTDGLLHGDTKEINRSCNKWQ